MSYNINSKSALVIQIIIVLFAYMLWHLLNINALIIVIASVASQVLFFSYIESIADAPSLKIHKGTVLNNELFTKKGLRCSKGYKVKDIDYSKVDINKPGSYSYQATCISETSIEGSIQVIPFPIITAPDIEIPMGTALKNDELFFEHGVTCKPKCEMKINRTEVNINKLGDYTYIVTAIDEVSPVTKKGRITIKKRPPIKINAPYIEIVMEEELNKEFFLAQGVSCSPGCKLDNIDQSRVNMNKPGIYTYLVSASDNFASESNEGKIEVIEKPHGIFNKAAKKLVIANSCKNKGDYIDSARYAKEALNLYQKEPNPSGESASFLLMSELAEKSDRNSSYILCFLIIGRDIQGLDENEKQKYERILANKLLTFETTESAYEAINKYAKQEYNKDKARSLIETVFFSPDIKNEK